MSPSPPPSPRKRGEGAHRVCGSSGSPYSLLAIRYSPIHRDDPMQRTKPPFRADHVGSLLRPAALKAAREQRAKGEITAAELGVVEDREIERAIRKQEEVGLAAVTDGEFRRSWWHLDFLWGLDGVERHVMDTGIAFAGVTTRNEGVRVTGKLGFSGHPMLEHFKYVAAHTGRMPKITIPAPSAIYGRPVRTPIDPAVYPKLDRFFDDLGQAYRKAVRAFADAGCRYLQLDEVFIAMLCDPKYRRQMQDRGDDPEHLGVLYGDLITTKRGALESKDRLKRRIEEAAKHAPLDQLCLSGQCGFASTEEGNLLTEDEQWAKLRRIVEVAEEVWG